METIMIQQHTITFHPQTTTTTTFLLSSPQTCVPCFCYSIKLGAQYKHTPLTPLYYNNELFFSVHTIRVTGDFGWLDGYVHEEKIIIFQKSLMNGRVIGGLCTQYSPKINHSSCCYPTPHFQCMYTLVRQSHESRSIHSWSECPTKKESKCEPNGVT